ncbi:MAG: poly(3-hydroxybutyrate) depolymerase [Rhizobiales bacterium]|nr:poly(3-hydroxybutyrate) depolymerase [Hyphomicrobiales bacterium]
MIGTLNRFLLAMAAAVFLSAQGVKAEAPLNSPIAGPGDYRYTFYHGGLLREYLVHIPRSWRRGTVSPVILALHGGGGDADYMADDRNYGLISKSEQVGFIAVFPNGVSPLASGLLATWNGGKCCGAARDRNIDDVGFLKAVTARVLRQAGGDPARVYSVGMSNGGIMSYRLACDAAGMLAGIMAVAGTDNTRTCVPARPVPVLHIHAINDDHVLFYGGIGPAVSDPSSVTDFVSVPSTIAKWVRLDKAVLRKRRVVSVPGAYCDRHDRLAGGAPVQLCVTTSGKHSWPGAQVWRSNEPPSQAIKATDEMWTFFNNLRATAQ